MKNNSGFTLVELLVVIGLIGVIALIAIPGFIDFLPKYRLKSAAQDLFGNFQKAKLTAVKRHKQATIQFTSNGYEIFVDDNTNFIKDGTDEEVLSVTWANYKDVTLNAETFENNTAGNPYIAFRSDGIPTDNVNVVADGDATLRGSNGMTMQVSVSKAGGIRIH